MNINFYELEEIDVPNCPFGSTHEIYNNTNKNLVLLDITAEK